ncbi:MAG: hypothetical protein ABL921_10980 [Pirellula sp.]
MHFRFHLVFALVLVITHLGLVAQSQDEPDKAQRVLENQVDLARFHGWQAALFVLPSLEAVDAAQFPGIVAFAADIRKFEKARDRTFPPNKWPVEDSDSLLLRNPNLWRAIYEVTPGDSSITVAHIGMLCAFGDLDEAYNLLALTRLDHSIPKDQGQRLFQMIFSITSVKRNASGFIKAGNEYYDRKLYDEAVAEYQKVLMVWPSCSPANYELEQTLRRRDHKDHGKFILSRRANPIQKESYQGTLSNEQVKQWQNMFRLVEKWNRDILKGKSATSELLLHFANQFQEAAILERRLHELALFSGQMVIARKGNYDPTDEAFIGRSLKELLPESEVQAIVSLLSKPADKRITISPRVGVSDKQ